MNTNLGYRSDTNRLWWVVRWLPESIVRFMKRHLALDTKLKLRWLFGAPVSDIPATVVTVPDGRSFNVGPNIGYWSIYYTNDYEPECTALLRDLVAPDDVVIDIGANIGWYTTLFASLVGKTGRVIAFEPVPSTYTALMSNIELNEMNRIVAAHQLALGKNSGEVEVYSFPGEIGMDSLSSLGRQEYTKSRSRLTTLDEFLTHEGMTTINLVKCDVEGSEMDILDGGKSLFTREDAPSVLIEMNDDTGFHFGYERADIFDKLNRFGYKEFFTIPAPYRMMRVNCLDDLKRGDMLLAGKNSSLSKRLIQKNWVVE